MKETVTIKVYPSTRASLKLISAMRQETIMDVLDWLVTKQLNSEKKKTVSWESVKSKLDKKNGI